MKRPHRFTTPAATPLLFFTLVFFAGCEKEEDITPTATTGDAVFYNTQDCNTLITVSLQGKTRIIDSYFPNGASCGSEGAATFNDIEPGTYNYTASGSNGSPAWSGTVTVKAGQCSKKILLCSGGTGGGGGGTGSGTGEAIFWIASDPGCGNITVSCNGQSRTISSYSSSGAPDCGTSGFANFTLNAGTYAFSASCSGGKTWNGNITVPDGGCSTMQLTSSGSGGGGGGGGGGNTCNWGSGSGYVSISSQRGTRCGQSGSIEVFVKNTSSQRIKIYACLQKPDGTWYSEADGTFNSGVAPGATKSFWNCSSNGYYKIGVMLLDDFLANGCPSTGPCQ